MILDKEFLPAGRILANRGLQHTGKGVTFSNCYVIESPEDNIESIFDCNKKLARTFSYGGGVGVDIGKLRPKGALVNNAAQTTSGAVSFMDLFSHTTEIIGQRGRRGALMISIPCTHPDLEEFIDIKSDLNRVTKANISIRATNEFIDAVVNKTDYTLEFELENGETIRKTIDAYTVFEKFAQINYDYAEPGLLFWDRISNWNLLSEDNDFEYASVNPCGEEPLPAGGSCLLGSINLSECVTDPFTEDSLFDFDKFIDITRKSVEALNEILDEGLDLHPLEEQRRSVGDWRQIGLGIMGLADMLIKLGMPYGDDESIELCGVIGKTMINNALQSSALLAERYGRYPKYDEHTVLSSPFLIENATAETKQLIRQHGLRNSQLLTCAPTGSLSTMLGISGGIEPIYALSHTRTTTSLHDGDVDYQVYTPIAVEYMQKFGIKSIKKLPPFFVTAKDLNYTSRIRMQACWQNYIDASISSTVNLPENTTVDGIIDLYISAWRSGIKGITVYRDGCARSGILSENNKDVTNDELTDDDGVAYAEVYQSDKCPDCGNKLTISEGCATCQFCGYGRCG